MDHKYACACNKYGCIPIMGAPEIVNERAATEEQLLKAKL